MLSKLVSSLIVLSALRGSYAAPAEDGLSVALSRIGFSTELVLTAATLGSDSSGHTSYSIEFGKPFTLASTATAPDTTLTAVATLVEGSTDAHIVEIATAGSESVTFNEDCALGDGYAACTVVEKGPPATLSTAFTVTLSPTSSAASAVPTNGAAWVGPAMASLLTGVVACVTLLGTMP
uniref:FAD-dependent monooxygenase DEP4 ) n=1 Tax=Ganoderma boninense TaxID=34458 RepID=A0A5K1K6Z3_9APHY|nr:FAD-dependent monooxygenase DEP4 (EC (Depudecin biosynthesis cluster protein 1) [Ganoderma boninense]